MRSYLVRIDAPVKGLRLGVDNPTRSEDIVVRASRRSVAIKRALEHWQAGTGRGVRRMIVIDAQSAEGMILPDDTTTWLD